MSLKEKDFHFFLRQSVAAKKHRPTGQQIKRKLKFVFVICKQNTNIFFHLHE